MKKITKILPEMFLLVGVILYWISASITINPIAIILLLLIGLSLYLKNKVLNIITSGLFVLLSLWMILALFSEFREFDTGDVEGIKMLVFGFLIFIPTLISAVFLGIKKI
jgi:hypothetical protein